MVSDEKAKLEKNRAPILIMSILIQRDSKLILPVPDNVDSKLRFHLAYVTGNGDDAVAVFSRASSTGALTFVEVQKDDVYGVYGPVTAT